MKQKALTVLTLLSLTIMMALTASSCSKNPEEQIVGEWIAETENGYLIGMEFDNDGTVYYREGETKKQLKRSEPDELQYEIIDDEITFTRNNSKTEITATYKFSDDGNTLTIEGLDDDDMAELDFERQ